VGALALVPAVRAVRAQCHPTRRISDALEDLGFVSAHSLPVEQTAAVDPGRLGNSEGYLSLEEMRRVDAALRIVLDL
jgi:mRNA-degrading endonuclease toxin of MazEF toxin-antitoxin module